MSEYNEQQKYRINSFLADFAALLLKHDACVNVEHEDNGLYGSSVELSIDLAIDNTDCNSESKVYGFVMKDKASWIDEDEVKNMIL